MRRTTKYTTGEVGCAPSGKDASGTKKEIDSPNALGQVVKTLQAARQGKITTRAKTLITDETALRASGSANSAKPT